MNKDKKIAVITEAAPKAIGPYNQAIVIDNIVFISGQIPFTKEGNLISDDIAEQTIQSLNNIESILKSIDLDRRDIVKTTIFLTNIKDFAVINERYSDFFKDTIFPARSTVEVSRLPKDVKIEIEAIATNKGNR